MNKNIVVIPAKPKKGNLVTSVPVKKTRVAAYCRVSTDTEEQATSYEAQKEHYTEYISRNNEWELVEIYADDGISALSTRNRDEFNRMIDDCKAGKIDMILTKSISRFARNTVDCLNYIRMLKEKNIPVFFEKENINTMDTKGEVLLTIMASLAQQESESLSQNVRLGMQYRFQQGKLMINTTGFLGYDKDEDGKLVINPEQAEIVKRIFLEYLNGSSCQKIAKGLENDGIPTVRGNTKWHDSVIRRILINEKYMGDALLQKTYTVDFLQKKRAVNNGEMPKYYIEDNHEPIIPKDTFMLVQKEIARRSSLKDNSGKRRSFSSTHSFSGIIYCSKCENSFNRIHWNNRGKKSIVWRCATRLKNSTGCNARTVKEEVLQNAFVEAINSMISDRSDHIKILQENISKALTGSSPLLAIDNRLMILEHELLDNPENKTQIAEEILDLREKRTQLQIKESSDRENASRMEEISEFLEKNADKISVFDDILAKRITDKVSVFDDRIVFRFKSGTEIEVEQ